MSIQKDYTGKRFNHLVLLHFDRSGGKGVGAYWKVRCDCGVVKSLLARQVLHGQVKTCGKCEYTSRLIDSRSRPKVTLKQAERIVFSKHTALALNRRVPWTLSIDQFLELIRDKCAFCGKEPIQGIRGSRLRYNGINRNEMSGGYTPENSITCCERCTRWKGASNSREFLEELMGVASNITRLLNNE